MPAWGLCSRTFLLHVPLPRTGRPAYISANIRHPSLLSSSLPPSTLSDYFPGWQRRIWRALSEGAHAGSYVTHPSPSLAHIAFRLPRLRQRHRRLAQHRTNLPALSPRQLQLFAPLGLPLVYSRAQRHLAGRSVGHLELSFDSSRLFSMAQRAHSPLHLQQQRVQQGLRHSLLLAPLSLHLSASLLGLPSSTAVLAHARPPSRAALRTDQACNRLEALRQAPAVGSLMGLCVTPR